MRGWCSYLLDIVPVQLTHAFSGPGGGGGLHLLLDLCTGRYRYPTYLIKVGRLKNLRMISSQTFLYKDS